MTILERIQREPAALLALATAVFAVLTGTGVLTEAGATVALGVVAASIGALRYVVTPSAEVVVQHKPDGDVQFGSAYSTDAEVDESVDLVRRERDLRGTR
ncbi:hypothetical protein GCM10023340_39050 [Nocardioides marinquilinus]|uniref:Uncharacterized protein n=1 Tax=Nocardioides marinquilinus TaxID=1210400 RepID=A0ABP9Q4Y7_9ACTN